MDGAGAGTLAEGGGGRRDRTSPGTDRRRLVAPLSRPRSLDMWSRRAFTSSSASAAFTARLAPRDVEDDEGHGASRSTESERVR
jgi:hypothetical protein